MKLLTPSLVFLVGVNLIPVIGVIFLGWTLSSLLILYWMESFVIGALNAVKIMMCNGDLGNRIGTLLFFLVHYGGFWLGHTLFLFAMLIPDIAKANGSTASDEITSLHLGWALAGLVASHVFSFFTNFIGKKEYLSRSPTVQMFAPYGRVFVLHIMILGGAAVLASFSSVLLVLLMFIALKIIFDGFFHAISHKGVDVPMDAPIAD